MVGLVGLVGAGGWCMGGGAGPSDGTSTELLLPSIHVNGAVAAFDARPSRQQASEGQVLERARRLGRASTIGTTPEVVVSRVGT